MSGRHRKKIISWTMPAGVAGSAGAVLVLAVWLTGGAPSIESSNAALALQAPTPLTTSSATPPPPPRPKSSSAAPEPTPPPAPATSTPKPKPKTTAKTPAPAACSTTLDGTKPHVAQVGNHIKKKFAVKDIGGVGARSGASDHPGGLALDFMTDTKTGNAIADYVLANKDKLAVTYVIWRQRYNDGSGWSPMEDRGSVTANHFDHVHVSFKPGATVSVTC
jgi:hypothetical protein